MTLPPAQPTEIGFDPAVPQSYRHWSEERVRYADLDPLGHVNNNALGVYFESARIGFYLAAGLYDEGPAIRSVVARLAIDFRTELRYPATVRIGTRLMRLGRTSFGHRQAIFRDDTCIATAETGSGVFDTGTRRPIPLTEGQRTRLSGFL